MAEFMRHVGKTLNTDRRIVVVYMQLPGREDHALVVDTDALPPQFHDELMDVVQGEGQRSPVLADILGRRIMAYTGVDILSSLHQAGKLTPMPISNILMLPQPNQPVPLSEVVKFMKNGQAPVPPQPVQEELVPQHENRFVEDQNIDKQNEQYQIARNILAEAELLEEEARVKRERAYSMYPALRPKPAVENKGSVKEEAAPVTTKTVEAEKVAKPKSTSRRSKKVNA